MIFANHFETAPFMPKSSRFILRPAHNVFVMIPYFCVNWEGFFPVYW